MTVIVEIPDSVAREMHLSAAEAQRRTMTSLVVDGYRKGELSRGQVSELLDLSFSETGASQRAGLRYRWRSNFRGNRERIRPSANISQAVSVVVSDTTPLNYLILIGDVDILPRLLGRVLVPPAVIKELKHPQTPPPVSVR